MRSTRSSSACGRSPRSWSVERLTTNPHAHRARGACVLTFVQNLMTSPTRGRTPNPAASPCECARHFVAGSALPRRRHESGVPRYPPSPLCGELRTSWLCNQTMRLGNDADAYTQHVSGDYTRVAVHVPKPTSGFVRGDADRIIGLARLGWPLCAIVDE